MSLTLRSCVVATGENKKTAEMDDFRELNNCVESDDYEHLPPAAMQIQMIIYGGW